MIFSLVTCSELKILTGNTIQLTSEGAPTSFTSSIAGPQLDLPRKAMHSFSNLFQSKAGYAFEGSQVPGLKYRWHLLRGPPEAVQGPPDSQRKKLREACSYLQWYERGAWHDCIGSDKQLHIVQPPPQSWVPPCLCLPHSGHA